MKNLSKAYDGLSVLKSVSLTLTSGTIYCLMGPSGSGKTTFFRILLGLEKADEGFVTGGEQKRAAVVFQEDRLCPSFTPVENVAMVLNGRVSKNRAFACKELLRVLPEEALYRPVSTLSGGMKRRVAIVRAVAAPWDFLLMDEPFTGLDQETRHLVIRYILEKAEGRLVLLSTHQEEDIGLLNGALIKL